MARPDMSPRAVTARLVRTAQLRRLCLLLRRREEGRDEAPRRPPSRGSRRSPGAPGGASGPKGARAG